MAYIGKEPEAKVIELQAKRQATKLKFPKP
jgi:hypothetical protein